MVYPIDHPTIQVNTNMQQQWVAAYPGLLGKMIKNVSLALGRDVEQGSYSGLYAAIHPEIVEKNYNGYYFTDPVSTIPRCYGS